MREIREMIFRGKRTDNGEWVYGYYTKARYFLNKKEMHIIFEPDVEAFPHCEFTGYEEVLPETVGQYTGLTDKNGIKIFEGDIVHCVSKLDSADMVVIFECGQFRMILAEKYHEYQTNVGYYDINCFAKEVIGNIHDNPELLKGGGDNG